LRKGSYHVNHDKFEPASHYKKAICAATRRKRASAGLRWLINIPSVSRVWQLESDSPQRLR
jgi:hypothetical protein